MGLDIGIMSVRYLERPRGASYRFAWELAHEASINGYMHGDGNNWGAFTQLQVLHMLDEFAEQHALDAVAKAEIVEWVRSLPWIGWNDDLPPGNTTHDDDYSPILDRDPEQDGAGSLSFPSTGDVKKCAKRAASAPSIRCRNLITSAQVFHS